MESIDDLSIAVANRLRDIARMLDRVDRLESGTGQWRTSQQNGDWLAAATDMTLRAVRLASDSVNFSILAILTARASLPMSELETATGLGRLALNERVSDLVQVGLAGRNIDTDHVQATAAGAALVAVVEDVGRAAAQRLAEALQPVTKS